MRAHPFIVGPANPAVRVVGRRAVLELLLLALGEGLARLALLLLLGLVRVALLRARLVVASRAECELVGLHLGGLAVPVADGGGTVMRDGGALVEARVRPTALQKLIHD
tara:strand:- start:2571 stop:2897 length:327 start_codon:yes stop_codon:yes gene_type:complete